MSDETTGPRGGYHNWGNPDADGVRACTKEGCTVRVANHFRVWQRKKGAHWRMQHKERIPECEGKTT